MSSVLNKLPLVCAFSISAMQTLWSAQQNVFPDHILTVSVVVEYDAKLFQEITDLTFVVFDA